MPVFCGIWDCKKQHTWETKPIPTSSILSINYFAVLCEQKVLPIYHHFTTRNKTLFYAAIFHCSYLIHVLVPFLYFQIASVNTIILQKFVNKNGLKFFLFPNRHLKTSENKWTLLKKHGLKSCKFSMLNSLSLTSYVNTAGVK